MSLVFHLLTLVLVLFCAFSYLLCGYTAFLYNDEKMSKVKPGVKFVLWLLSPIIVLDLIVEHVFGWSLMS